MLPRKNDGKLNDDGKLNVDDLNKVLIEKEIILPDDSNWGASDAKHTIGVQISYIYNTEIFPQHKFKEVGQKVFKGIRTENIEIAIYTVSKAGYWNHKWVLLTDLSIKDIK